MWKESLTIIFIVSIQIIQSLPLTSNVTEVQEVETITESAPVELPQKCPENDTECEQKRKRRNLCEQNTGNSAFCGSDASTEDADYGPNESDEEVRDIIVKTDNGTVHFLGRVESSGANVTTIIKLTNIIENKNFIDMPTILNNTNVNNIHIINNRSSDEGGRFGLGYTEDGPCCYLVKQKNCKQTTMGTQCSHHKKKMCGRECKSRVIHHQTRSKCIPQWPYYNNCNQHGNSPSFYPPQFMPPMMPQPIIYDDEYDDDDFNSKQDDDDDSSWKKVAEKCKVVNEDGIVIKNCSESSNPFAKSRSSGKSKRHLSHKTNDRNYEDSQEISYQQQPQIIYYPMPMYVQPMPMIMPPAQFNSQSRRRRDYDDFDDDDEEFSDETTTHHRRHQHRDTSATKKSKRHQFYEEI